jgi:hypothetical protein
MDASSAGTMLGVGAWNQLGQVFERFERGAAPSIYTT